MNNKQRKKAILRKLKIRSRKGAISTSKFYKEKYGDIKFYIRNTLEIGKVVKDGRIYFYDKITGIFLGWK